MTEKGDSRPWLKDGHDHGDHCPTCRDIMDATVELWEKKLERAIALWEKKLERAIPEARLEARQMERLRIVMLIEAAPTGSRAGPCGANFGRRQLGPGDESMTCNEQKDHAGPHGWSSAPGWLQ